MEQIRIIVNGVEKMATGLTKETTVDDIKFAMLYSSLPKFKPEMLNEFGLFEEWQSNERLLDSNVKIYKIIKLWKQIPGDQLSQVKFIIKQKYTSSNNKNRKQQEESLKEFKLCSLSPSAQKTWNKNLIQKSSFVRKQLEKLNSQSQKFEDDLVSVNSIPSSAWSSGNESDCESNETTRTTKKGFASVKRFNRSRNSSVKRILERDEENKKLNEIKQLRNELKQIQTEMLKTRENKENNCLVEMRTKLNKIDNLILVKTSLIESLENELKRLNETNQQMKSSNSSSSIGSTDTGISSAHSGDEDETNYRFETLV